MTRWREPDKSGFLHLFSRTICRFAPRSPTPFPLQALQAPTRVLSGETLTSGGHV